MEVLLALLLDEPCVRLSVAFFYCSLLSDAGRSDVCGVTGLTGSRKHQNRSLALEQGVAA